MMNTTVDMILVIGNVTKSCQDLIIGELKEEVVTLNGRWRQLEAQVNHLDDQNMHLNILTCAHILWDGGIK